MAFKRKTSQIIASAQERSTNLKAISAALDLGSGLSSAAFDSEIAAAQTALDAYNSLLAKADAAGNEFKTTEKRLRTFSARMLAGVGAVYGKDSSEYEMAGGTRASEINYRPGKPKQGGEG